MTVSGAFDDSLLLCWFTETRMEDFVYSKLDRKPPGRLNNAEQLGVIMKEAGEDFGPGTSYGEKMLLLMFLLLMLLMFLLLMLFHVNE